MTPTKNLWWFVDVVVNSVYLFKEKVYLRLHKEGGATTFSNEENSENKEENDEATQNCFVN